MNKRIEVNGAKIEKKFFDENVREAKGYDWTTIPVTGLSEHVHCLICEITIDPKSLTMTHAYKSKGGYVCDYCYEHFLK